MSRPSRIGPVIILSLSTLFATAAALGHCSSPSPQPIAAHPGSLVCRLDWEGGRASAVPIARRDGFTILLTARHAVDEPHTVVARQGDHEEVVVSKVLHNTIDIALLWVRGEQFQLVEMDLTPLLFGDPVQSSGFALGRIHVLSEGFISADGRHCTASAIFGCSGGAVLRGGRLVGIVSALPGFGANGLWMPLPTIQLFVPLLDISEWMRAILK